MLSANFGEAMKFNRAKTLPAKSGGALLDSPEAVTKTNLSLEKQIFPTFSMAYIDSCRARKAA